MVASKAAYITALFRGQPTTRLMVGATLAALLTIAVIVMLGWLPRADFQVTLSDDEQQVSFQGQRFGVDDRVTLVSAADSISLPFFYLIDYWEPREGREQRIQFYAYRDKVAQVLRQPDAQLLLPDGTRQAVGVNTGFQLPSVVVLVNIFSGLGAGLVGLWLLCIAATGYAARAVSVAGLAFHLNTLVIAGLMSIDPASGGEMMRILLLLNYPIALLSGLGLLALFARYPLPLVSRPLLWGLLGLPLAVMAGLYVVDADSLFNSLDVMVSVVGLVLILLMVWQVRRSWHRPDLRAIFRWIGSALLLSVVGAVFLQILPQLNSQPGLDRIAFINVLFLLFFVSLAVAVRRYRLFDLERWSVQIMRAALVLVVVLGLDLAVAVAVGSTWALSAAVFMALLVWMPVREYVVRRSLRKRSVENIALLRHANRVAFAPEGQAQIWAGYLQSQFQPLSVEPAVCDEVAIQEDGQSLLVPSPLTPTGHCLRFAAQGTRLFNRADEAIARAMIRLVREMATARDAYDKGAQAERLRIARDLHDDVGARLMTSLHRQQVQEAQDDVRHAMSEMRLIIDGLCARQRRLDDVLADLRHETVNRLQLAQIQVHWPLAEPVDEVVLIGHAVNRTLHATVRELVSNIIRHAGARQVQVHADLRDHALYLRVQDDGKGLPAQAGQTGNGLTNTHRRLAEIGGRLTREPLRSGTAMLACIPLSSPEQGMATLASDAQ